MRVRDEWVISAIVVGVAAAWPFPSMAEESPVIQEAITTAATEPVENAQEEAVKISVSRPVHFSSPDGSDVVAEPGQYRVEGFDSLLRLFPIGQGSPITIDSVKGTQESGNEIPIALALPGETEEEGDLFNVMLMVPGGASLETTGTYSGVKPRGLFDDVFKQAKKGVGKAIQQTKKITADVNKGVDLCRSNPAVCRNQGADIAAKRAEQHLQEATALAIQAKKETERLARMHACRVAVATIKAGKLIGGVMPLGLPGMKQLIDSMQRRIDQDSVFREQIRMRINQAVDGNRFMLPELSRLTAYVKNSANQGQMDALFTSDVFCSGSMAQFDNKLRQLGLVPSFSMAQPRGVDDAHFYMGLQLTGDVAAVGGYVIGLTGVTDFRGNGGFFWFHGPQAGISVGAGGVLELTFFPKVNEASFVAKNLLNDAGWGVGATAGVGAVGAVDVAFDQNWNFQGFGLGGGGGVGPTKMFGSLVVSKTWSNRIGE